MKKKFVITTTIPASLNFFIGYLAYLNEDYEVIAISSQLDELKSIGSRERIRTHHIPMKRPISILSDIIGLLKFIIFFIEERPYFVHGNTPKASFLSMIAAKITFVKVRIYMCHGLRYQGTNGILKWLLMQMEKITCFCASEVICVSHGVRETLVKDGLCKDNKAVVIHHGSAAGIDLKKFVLDDINIDQPNIRKNLSIMMDDLVFVYIGRIVKDKGIGELVSAIIKLHGIYERIHLVIVGADDNQLDPIDSITREKIIQTDYIHAVGLQNDVRPYLRASDVFVLPSYREGFGMVLLEAGAMGLPCIATNISGCNEIIVNGENGILIPPKDENELFQAMKFFIENPEELNRMGSNSRPMAASRYERGIVWAAQRAEYKRLEEAVK